MLKTLLNLWHNWIGVGVDPTPPDLLEHSPKITSTAFPSDNWNELSENDKFRIRKEHFEKIKLKLK